MGGVGEMTIDMGGVGVMGGEINSVGVGVIVGVTVGTQDVSSRVSSKSFLIPFSFPCLALVLSAIVQARSVCR